MSEILIILSVGIGGVILGATIVFAVRYYLRKRRDKKDGYSFIKNMYDKHGVNIESLDSKVHTLDDFKYSIGFPYNKKKNEINDYYYKTPLFKTYVSSLIGGEYKEKISLKNYKENEKDYKDMIDNSPIEVLETLLNESIEYEIYELAQYISDKLKQKQ